MLLRLITHRLLKHEIQQFLAFVFQLIVENIITMWYKTHLALDGNQRCFISIMNYCLMPSKIHLIYKYQIVRLQYIKISWFIALIFYQHSTRKMIYAWYPMLLRLVIPISGAYDEYSNCYHLSSPVCACWDGVMWYSLLLRWLSLMINAASHELVKSIY